MARNDGKNYSVARNGKYTRSQIGNIERHNERKNEVYQNTDIQLERSDMNIYFKQPTDGYLATFDKMCEDGTISTRGLKDTAIIIDEMLFDVNTTYFEKRGGYEYAKEFFAKAYEYAVREVGGEQYILSAVMHADERNQEVSERLGKDVYHYHLHVMYVPVVQKEIKWSKRCKDKSLVGTVKEVITQVSHSKKWASHKETDENGETQFVKSYSLLQDRFFEYMQSQGYTDIERGEKGSTDKHKKATQFKADKEEQRLEENVAKVLESETILAQQNEEIGQNDLTIQGQKSELSKISGKKAKIKAIDSIETKSAVFGKGKIVVDEAEFEEVKALAKKQITTESREKKLATENTALKQRNQALLRENSQQAIELSEHNSVTNRLNANKQKIKMQELETFKDVVLKFLDFMGLRQKFEQFRQAHSKTRTEER